jgi:hypothetical protein
MDFPWLVSIQRGRIVKACWLSVIARWSWRGNTLAGIAMKLMINNVFMDIPYPGRIQMKR